MSFPLFGSKDKEKKPRATPIRKSVRAGLRFPVGRVHRHLKEKEYEKRIQTKASVYVTAVLEYLCAELFEISGRVAKEMNRKIISRRHLELAIRNDDELNKLLANVIIPQSKVSNFKPKRKDKNAKNKQAIKPNQPNTLNMM